MTSIFDRRERAAEAGFAHAQERRFVTQRAGTEALADWAADGMGLKDDARTAYVTAIRERFLAGARETDIVLRVGSDLERAGKPALSTHADAIYARAVAEAADGRAHTRA